MLKFRSNLIIASILLSTILYSQNSNTNFKSNTPSQYFQPSTSLSEVQTTNGKFPLIDTGTGIPILLLHGFPDTKEIWESQIQPLVNAGYRVIAPDLRGYGKAPSPLEKEQYSIPILMNDVIGILDSLKLEKVHLVGHDWGASLSWQLARFFEDRFDSLTVLSVGFPENRAWSSVEQRRKSWYFYLFLQEGLAEKTFADNNWQFTKDFLSDYGHKQVDEVVQRLQSGNSLTTALNWYRGNLQNRLTQPGVDYTPTNEAPVIPQNKIKIPVLGIWGDRDLALSEGQMTQSSDFAESFTYKKIIGAGHWIMLDKAKELNKLMQNFLQQQK